MEDEDCQHQGLLQLGPTLGNWEDSSKWEVSPTHPQVTLEGCVTVCVCRKCSLSHVHHGDVSKQVF